MISPPLPFDIHARIIQFIYILSQSHDVDYATLSACALVCKDWTAPAQRLLFRRIIRPGNTDADPDPWLDRAAPLLLRLFASHPHLSTYVRSIAIRALPNHIELLRRCPHIALLKLVGASPPPPEWLHALRALRLHPSVLSVSVPADGERFRVRAADRDALHAMLAALPSVRHLVISARALVDLVLPPTSQLLSVMTTGGIDLSNLCLLPVPPSPAAEISFEDLHVNYLHWSQNMTSVERSVVRNLHSLTTTFVPPRRTLEHLLALESLIIGRLDYSTGPFTLPRTLRHFGFHTQHNTNPSSQAIQTLSAALSERALPVLQMVSTTRCSHHAVRGALKEVAAARSIEFVEYADVEAYPRARYVDWISM
ncbi:hypothetical protein FA95DRAFT_1567206 [Auriscalpium vulgare]|uniref:Uncharacterized protein n=1 Tax=Auriscalpium vulgare TaxID=40419 RepID=A0ACB8R5J2_9AGAM|nr:hypothetical protein FA95DRAFT_1567206 [Auriscalpium vulgare]